MFRRPQCDEYGLVTARRPIPQRHILDRETQRVGEHGRTGQSDA